MNRDILKEIVELEPIVVQFTNFYGDLSSYSDRIWEAYSRNSVKDVITAVDIFTMMIPARAWRNKTNNGLQKLLDFTVFGSELEKDLATGKRKLTRLEDL